MPSHNRRQKKTSRQSRAVPTALSTEQNTVSNPKANYTALDRSKRQIRVLILLPAVDEDNDIHCHLRTISLEEKEKKEKRETKYEALSYTWGDPSNKNIIYINQSPFKVTKNLYIALRYLRESVPRTLWVDAICINQESVEERNFQVRQMRAIYAGASQVLVWLGESDEDTDEAIDVLLHLSKTKRESLEELEEIREPCLPVLAGIGKIFNSAWWKRIWVIQETAVAAKCPLACCGRKWVPYEILTQAKYTISLLQLDHRSDDMFPKGFPRLDSFDVMENLEVPNDWGLQTVDQARRSLIDVLWFTSRRQATEPRDKIFAVIGLYPSQFDESLLPDYNLSISEVYQRAMLVMIIADVDCLLHITANEIQLPTWCIDFSNKDWSSKSYLDVLAGNAQASGRTSQGLVHRDIKNHSITLSGVKIGIVQHCTWRRNTLVSLKGSSRTPTGAEVIGGLLDDVAQFTLESCSALMSRVGMSEICKMLTGGDFWQVVNGGCDFDTLIKRLGYTNKTL